MFSSRNYMSSIFMVFQFFCHYFGHFIFIFDVIITRQTGR